MMIIGTLGLLVIPRIAGRRKHDRVTAQARLVVTLARTARARAASEGRTYLIVIDPLRREVRLARRRDPLAEADQDEQPELELADEAASWSRPLAFEDDVRVASVQLAGAAASNVDPVTIAFRPNGDADAARVVFEVEAQDQAAVLVDPAQGRCRLVEP